MSRIILDLCGGTGSWSKPYVLAGYDVRLVTLPAGDVLTYEPPDGVHGILAAPPCTVFAASGSRWHRSDEAMWDALLVVDACLRIIEQCKPVWWALENPVGKLVHYLGKPVMYFQPYEYGDPYTKKTCLWGMFNQPVKRLVEPVEGSKLHRLSPSPDRAMLRSITPSGFAQAFYEANP